MHLFYVLWALQHRCYVLPTIALWQWLPLVEVVRHSPPSPFNPSSSPPSVLRTCAYNCSYSVSLFSFNRKKKGNSSTTSSGSLVLSLHIHTGHTTLISHSRYCCHHLDIQFNRPVVCQDNVTALLRETALLVEQGRYIL